MSQPLSNNPVQPWPVYLTEDSTTEDPILKKQQSDSGLLPITQKEQPESRKPATFAHIRKTFFWSSHNTCCGNINGS